MDAGLLMNRTSAPGGFTLVEVLLAMVMLSVVLLASAGSTTRYLSLIAKSRIKVQAAAVADARISEVRVSPAYDSLTIRFDSTHNGRPFQGYSRVTEVVRTGAGSTSDLTRVTVTVSGPELVTPVVRYATIAAP
jgi:prepilin-type N-terminal cleavage/methylation domain-containing protein